MQNEVNSHPTSSISGFISAPETLQEFEHNAKFQLDNVSGLLGIKDYESALIKARCLIDALEKIVENFGQ